MIGATRTDLPPELFPDDPWALIEAAWAPEFHRLTETLFALSNGNIGVRGQFSECVSETDRGTFLNGLYESWPIVHPEFAYGLADLGQTIVNLPDATQFEISIDGVALYPSEAISYSRRLDFRQGLLIEQGHYRGPSGIETTVRRERMVSLSRPDTLGMRLEITTNKPARVDIKSTLTDRQRRGAPKHTDPRKAAPSSRPALLPISTEAGQRRILRSWQTAGSMLPLAIGVDHSVSLPHSAKMSPEGSLALGIQLSPNQPVVIAKWAVFQISTDPAQARQAASDSLDVLTGEPFEHFADEHRQVLDHFWKTADIAVDAGPQIQRAIRWTLFQLRQASMHLDRRSIPAKGLTGQAYDGHYFWDTEIYVMPFLASADPAAAAEVIRYRHATLPQARRRAAELSQKGALYPWRTISGDESSAYFLAGTAQYHIDADIVYAIRHYSRVTGDEQLVRDLGVEIAIETARMWEDLGFYRDGAFHIHGVTGPDEYTALVDDNAYTNAMARMNLRYAAELLDQTRHDDPVGFEELAGRLLLDPAEATAWAEAARSMWIPHDRASGLTPQDGRFLERERWDFEGTPLSKYPLLLHFHPLVIYRFQVLKQADVLLANFLLWDEFDPETKRRNFDFYDPITTGDSSLSPCVHAIMGMEVGRADKALKHFLDALFIDMADLAGNAADGVHMASAGGVWLALVSGFGGMRIGPGAKLRFKPWLPDDWKSLTLRIQHRGVHLTVELTAGHATFTAEDGDLTIEVGGDSIGLAAGRPETVAISQLP